MLKFVEKTTNPRGIPTISFIVRNRAGTFVPFILGVRLVSVSCLVWLLKPFAAFSRCTGGRGGLLGRERGLGRGTSSTAPLDDASSSAPLCTPAAPRPDILSSRGLAASPRCFAAPLPCSRPQVTIGAFTEMLQKYKMMEGSLTRQKASLKIKVRRSLR